MELTGGAVVVDVPDGSPRVGWVPECHDATVLKKEMQDRFGDLAHGWPCSAGGGWGHDLRPAARDARYYGSTIAATRHRLPGAKRATGIHGNSKSASKSAWPWREVQQQARSPGGSCFRGSSHQTEAPEQTCWPLIHLPIRLTHGTTRRARAAELQPPPRETGASHPRTEGASPPHL